MILVVIGGVEGWESGKEGRRATNLPEEGLLKKQLVMLRMKVIKHIHNHNTWSSLLHDADAGFQLAEASCERLCHEC